MAAAPVARGTTRAGEDSGPDKRRLTAGEARRATIPTMAARAAREREGGLQMVELTLVSTLRPAA
jgi:hypothetical protein